tara:strand:- start:684 stop:1046 length:363 start_codon:yes stop_codon:yes gene_type:complete
MNQFQSIHCHPGCGIGATVPGRDEMDYKFAYQEWDIMRKKPPLPAQRIDKSTYHVLTSSARSPQFCMVLQEARILKRMSVLDVATLLGTSSTTVSNFENGTEVPSTEMCSRIRSALDIRD